MSPKLDPKQDYTPGKLSKTNMIGWKIHHLKLYFLLKMGILQCYVSFQGYTWQESENRAYNPPSYVMLCWFPTISFLGCKNPPSLDWWNHQIFGEKKSPIRNLEVGMFCQAGVEEGVMVWERCFLFGGGTMGVELNDPIVAWQECKMDATKCWVCWVACHFLNYFYVQ